MCELLDGGAYEEMDEREQQIYNTIIDTMQSLFRNYKTTDNKDNITTWLGLVMSAIDNAESNFEKGLNELKLLCIVFSVIS